MPRLSITLTDSQAAALERIAAETGATKQSMIGLAVSAWIRKNDVLPMETPKTPEKPSRDLTWWYGWCRTYTPEDGSRDHDRQRFDTESDAMAHAHNVAAKYPDAQPLWEECDSHGIPTALL